MKVLTETRDRTLVVQINRPEVRNCVDGETAQGLFEAVDGFKRDDALEMRHEDIRRTVFVVRLGILKGADARVHATGFLVR